jgi:hypothetical protein
MPLSGFGSTVRGGIVVGGAATAVLGGLTGAAVTAGRAVVTVAWPAARPPLRPHPLATSTNKTKAAAKAEVRR